MITHTQLLPGVTLHCKTDRRFKQNTLSMVFVRPTCDEEAGLNALLPAVLLRGCKDYPDMRQVILKLDDLYGAGVTSAVRITGDYQSTGIACSFIDDRFALPGDTVLKPMTEFLYKLLREPHMEKGVFSREYVESERKNLLAAIDSRKNDKRVYASDKLLALLCKQDSFGVPRLGRREQVEAITPESLWRHYEKLLRESPAELFYVGSAEPACVAQLVKPLFEGLERKVTPLPPQTALSASAPCEKEEEMEVAQGRLSMAFTSDVHVGHPLLVPTQVFTLLYGGSTGKLFNVVREKLSLCYDIGATFFNTKGFMSIHAGIDFDKKDQAVGQIRALLQECCDGKFTEAELTAAKQSLITSLQTSQDSPGAIEGFYMTNLLSGRNMELPDYIRAVRQVTADQVRQAAATFKCNTVYFLKGVQ